MRSQYSRETPTTSLCVDQPNYSTSNPDLSYAAMYEQLSALVPRVVFRFVAEEKCGSQGQRRACCGPNADHWCPLYEPRELGSVCLVVRYHQSDEADPVREDAEGEHWNSRRSANETRGEG